MTIIQRLRNWALKLKNHLTILYFASKDKNTHWYSKALIGVALAYALSPIDLIPDFIPILGLLDDLILLPLLISLAYKTIPSPIIENAKEKASITQVNLNKSWKGIFIVLFLWALIVLWFYNLLIKS